MDIDINTHMNKFSEIIAAWGPKILAAFAIPIVGYFIAKIFSLAVGRGLGAAGLNRRISGDEKQAPELERGLARGTFWLVMLFVLNAFFQTLELTIVTQPITHFLNTLFEYAPRLIGPIILLVIAWALAKLARVIVCQGVEKSGLGYKGAEDAGDDDARGEDSLRQNLGEAAYWLVFLLFLPAILGALNLGGLLLPVQGMVEKFLAFLPNVFAAGIIVFVGWFVAKVVRQVATSFLRAANLDQLTEKAGLAGILGPQGVTGLIGLILYVLVFVPVLIAGVNTLGIDAVSDPASQMLNGFLTALPNIFAALILLGVTYIAGCFVSGLLTTVLSAAGFDNILSKIGISGALAGKAKPSAMVGALVLTVILWFAAIEAVGLLGFTALIELLSNLLVFASHILMGVVIIGVGVYLAQLAANAIGNSKSAQASLMASIARVAIILLAGSIGLRQMGLADEIVTLAFTCLIGTIAVATAIAFGIGGRDVAAKVLDRWSESIGHGAPKSKS